MLKSNVLKDQKKLNRRGAIHLSLGLASGLLSTRIIRDGLINEECPPGSEQVYPICSQNNGDMHLKPARKAVNEEKVSSIPGTYKLEHPINGMQAFTIWQEERQLYLEISGYTSIALKPAGKDRFSAKPIGRIYHFYNNEEGQTEKVSIQRMSTGREEGIAIKKV